MIVGSCCEDMFRLNPMDLVVWIWVARVCTGLLFTEALAVFVVVGRGKAHRWRFWQQKMVLWLCMLGLLALWLAEHTGSELGRLAAAGATSAGCADFACTQDVLVSTTATALLGTALLCATLVTLLLGVVHLAAAA